MVTNSPTGFLELPNKITTCVLSDQDNNDVKLIPYTIWNKIEYAVIHD